MPTYHVYWRVSELNDKVMDAKDEKEIRKNFSKSFSNLLGEDKEAVITKIELVENDYKE